MEALLDRHPLRFAMEARDLDGVADALAPDVVLHSPVTSSFRFVGRDEVTALLGIVRELLDDLQYVEEFGDGHLHVLFFRARVNGRPLEGTDIMRLDEERRIRELNVFIRPLPALTALTAALAPRLARKTGRTRSATVAGMTRPLAAITRLADGPVSKLTMGKAWATQS